MALAKNAATPRKCIQMQRHFVWILFEAGGHIPEEHRLNRIVLHANTDEVETGLSEGIGDNKLVLQCPRSIGAEQKGRGV